MFFFKKNFCIPLWQIIRLLTSYDLHLSLTTPPSFSLSPSPDPSLVIRDHILLDLLIFKYSSAELRQLHGKSRLLIPFSSAPAPSSPDQINTKKY